MCGIFGVVGAQDAIHRMVNGLRKVEYRGYDSAGLALVRSSGLEVHRATGELDALAEVVANVEEGACGVAHTRWATHGPATVENAHPHRDAAGRVAVVHNGIIENHASIRAMLDHDGPLALMSQTDTELVAHLLGQRLAHVDASDDDDLLATWSEVLEELEGAFALAVAIEGRPDLLLIARRFSPMILAHSDGVGMVASDPACVADRTLDILYLEDGDHGMLTATGATLLDASRQPVERSLVTIDWSAEASERGGYPTFMLKEIHDQSAVLRAVMRGRIRTNSVVGIHVPMVPDLIRIVACGTAYYAGMMTRFLIERLSGIPVIVDHAHEFRYHTPTGRNTLVIGISQSGETADTIAAMTAASERGFPTFAIINRPNSTIARMASEVLDIRAGPEIGVASTKAFTGQVMGGLLLAMHLGLRTGWLPMQDFRELTASIRRVPTKAETLLSSSLLFSQIRAARTYFHGKGHAFFLGRNLSYPIAMESALKLKEISYIHAEGYAGGELKHGPLALIEDNTPVIVIASPGETNTKLIGNAHEVKARGANVIIVGPKHMSEEFDAFDHFIEVPTSNEVLQPLLSNMATQLLAHEVALERGCNVDRPRNLAKSVTVE